jgi:hypothetical protein
LVGSRRGDTNTTLFHASARFRKGKNFISMVVSREGQTLSSHEDKEAEFADFYNGLLGTFENREVTIDLDALGLPSHELVQLDAPFSMEEVWETIKRLSSDKRWDRMVLQGGSTSPAGLSSRRSLWQQFLVYGLGSSGTWED